MPLKRICCVPNCFNESKKGWTLFSIPKDEELRKVWCERVGLDISTLKYNPLLCQLHFNENDLIIFANSFRLRVGALPHGSGAFISLSPGKSSDVPSSQSLSSPPKLTLPKEQHESPMKVLQAKRKLQLMQNVTPSPSSDASRQTQLSVDDPTYRTSDIEEEMANVKKRRLSIFPDSSRNFIVNEYQLLHLLRRCPSCGSSSGIDIAAECFGVDVKYSIACSSCDEHTIWSTQPDIEDTDLNKGNLDFTAATVLAGGTYEDMHSVAANMNLQILSEPTFYRYAAAFVYPTVDKKFYETETKIKQHILDEQNLDPNSALAIAIDTRYSRPGYTATYSVTSALDLASGKILGHILKSKTDNDVESSVQMEVVATKTLIKSLITPLPDDFDEELSANNSSDEWTGDQPSTSAQVADESPKKDLRIRLVVTDESTAVIKMMRDNFPNIKHEADPWHLNKSLMRHLTKAANKKGHEMLQYWQPSIRKFLWTALENCSSDPELLLEQWRSMKYHVAGCHSWSHDTSFEKFKQCAHGDLSKSNIGYLPTTSKSFQSLAKIIDDKRIHKRLVRCTEFKKTSAIESFHSVLSKYVPKKIHFKDASFVARTKLAIMDWNFNVGRPIKTNMAGEEIISFTVPASIGDWRARPIFEKRSNDWAIELMNKINEFALKHWLSSSKLDRRKTFPMYKSLVSTYEPPDKEKLTELFSSKS